MIRAKYHGKKIIAGVDICQRLSGGALKMAAFEKLLVDYNLGEKGAVVLIQRYRIVSYHTIPYHTYIYKLDCGNRYVGAFGQVRASRTSRPPQQICARW